MNGADERSTEAILASLADIQRTASAELRDAAYTSRFAALELAPTPGLS